MPTSSLEARSSAQRGHIVDSQSVKTTGVGAEDRGYDGGKKIKGHKRHLLVDTEGFVLKAKIHSAKVMDYEGIKTLLRKANEHFPRLSHLWLDAGYRGQDKGKDGVQRRPWGGVLNSLSARESPLPERCRWLGPGNGLEMAWWSIGSICCLLKAFRCCHVGV
jgi:transposase